MRTMMKAGGMLVVAWSVAGLHAADADDLPLLPARDTEDVVVLSPKEPAAEPREASDTGIALAAGTEAEVVEGALAKGCARVKIAAGPHAGETLWVPATCLGGNGRLRAPGAGEDSTAKVGAFRNEAAYLKSQKSEGSTSDAFMGIMSDEQVMLPQKTRVTIVPNGTKLPGLALVQILDDGKHKGARLLVKLEAVVLEGKVKIGAAGGKAVTGFRTQKGLSPALATGRGAP